MSTLVLLRHGESEWNAKNLFTGWVDVDLTAKGEVEARRGGELLREHDLLPDVVHTSVQKRAIRTAELSLHVADRAWIPVRRHWRLNERHYGALQGKNKKETLEQYGEEQFMLWRRSYDVPPPPIDDRDEYSQAGDARYADLPPELKPRTDVTPVNGSVRRHVPSPLFLNTNGEPIVRPTTRSMSPSISISAAHTPKAASVTGAAPEAFAVASIKEPFSSCSRSRTPPGPAMTMSVRKS